MNLAIIVPCLAFGLFLFTVVRSIALRRRRGPPLRPLAMSGHQGSDSNWQEIALAMENRLQEANRKHGELLNLLVEAEQEIGLLRAENAVKDRNRDAGPAPDQYMTARRLH